MIRILSAAGLCGLLLAACSPGGKTADPNDPNAGLDKEIVGWRNDLVAQNPACTKKVDGHGCVSFEVTCKAMQEISPDEAKTGITAQVIAAMTFNGHGPDGSEKPGSAFALFSKAGGQWTRAEAMPVKMDTCAPL